jgi:hypothetical protein
VDRVFYLAVYGLAGVLVALGIAAFGIGQHLYSVYGLTTSRIGYDHTFVGLRYTQLGLGKTSQRLSLGIYVVVLAIVVCLGVKSIVTKVRCRGDGRVRMVRPHLKIPLLS